MRFSYNWLNSYFKTGLLKRGLPKAERLADSLSTHGFEVEGMEETGRDTILDVKVLPDRAHYALSHRGLAREAGAIIGLHVERKVRRDAPLAPEVAAVKVLVDDARFCRRYMARRIEGVKVGDSPIEIRQRLEAIGARSINSVVDATNFVMFDIGQPLHAFDADKIAGDIRVRLAKEGEKIALLDGREVELKASDLVIADGIGPLAIAGVKGGKRAEVTKETRNIVIESANFDPATVRRMSTRLDLRNDSSKRFENEITPALAYEALDRVTKLVWDVSPESKAGPATDVYPHPAKERTISVAPLYIRKTIGADIADDDIVALLERLDMRVTRDVGLIHVTPPLERLDIHIPEDIADEVGRLYGYEDLASKELPETPLPPVDKGFYWSEKAKNELVDMGFSETLLYTLVPKGAFEIAYPLASDKAALRERIAPKLQESLLANSRNAELLGLEAIKIFEIGKIFPKTGERTSLCLGVSLAKKRKGVTSESVLLEAVANLEKAIGTPLKAEVETGTWGALAEFDFDAVLALLPQSGKLESLAFAALPKDKRYEPFSPYPFIVRDIALFAPSQTKEEDVSRVLAGALQAAAGSLLVKGPNLFDRFEKDGKVSYAYRMVFQSKEKTLSDEEANGFVKQACESAKAQGWQVR
ncbi:MAG: phenylalanine--tRNA ligase subunit beta [Candidatus Taylorbacteria bacterium]|nr:phenylalanine--tRNA ligase subunit beta [Candidatus Taylorbacteria bacterium]